MIKEEQHLCNEIGKVKDQLQNITQESFNNPVDFFFKKASMEGELTAYQNVMVTHRKAITESSEVEAAILMHKTLKDLSDKHRQELAEIEKLENQEDEKITTDRGRLNGLIDGYNNSRIYFDGLTSEHAAQRQRTLKK